MKAFPSLIICLNLYLLYSLTAAINASAQEPSANIQSASSIDIQTALGFSETFRIERWTPLTVTLTNHSHNDIIGQLNVEVRSGDEFRGGLYTTRYQHDIQLSRDSRKRFRFTVFLDNPSRPLTIRLIVGGQTIAEQTIDLRQRFSDASLLLVLSRDADLDYLNDSSGRQIRVLYPHPELLPDHWQGYDGISALIIHGVSLESLSTKQFEAMQKWLAQGGVIVISGGPDYALLRTPRLAELLPATPVAVEQITAPDFLGGNDLISVHRLIHQQGRVLKRAADLPLLIEQKNGHGRVLYMTFDIARPPFDHWPGMPSLWTQQLRLSSALPLELSSAGKNKDNENRLDAIIRTEAKQYPQHISVLMFLVLYLALLASAYRLASSAEYAKPWLTGLLWSVPLIFALTAYLLFGPLLFPKGNRTLILSTVEAFPDSSYAHLQLDLGFYAITGYQSSSSSLLKFSYADVEPVFQPDTLATPLKRQADWVFNRGTQPAVYPEDNRNYVLHRLNAEDIVSFDVEGFVTATNSGPQLQVRNHSGRMLQHSWLIFDNRAYALGDIAAGAEIKKEFASSDAMDLRDIADPHEARLPTAALSFLKYSVGHLRKQQNTAKQPLLIAFSDSPLRLSGATQFWQRLELSLVRLPLPLISNTDADHADSGQ